MSFSLNEPLYIGNDCLSEDINDMFEDELPDNIDELVNTTLTSSTSYASEKAHQRWLASK